MIGDELFHISFLCKEWPPEITITESNVEAIVLLLLAHPKKLIREFALALLESV